MNKEKKAFTLIELLVVIAIIGLLSTLSIIALNSARAKARDAKRISDVKQMQVALEMYYNDMGEYPDDASVTMGAALYSTGNENAPFLRAVPSAPTPADGDVCADTATADYDSASYLYKKTNKTGGGIPSYTIAFCLGSDVGQGTSKITGNKILHMTPSGVFVK